MVDRVVLGATIRSTLTSIQKSRENLDNTSLRLASGRRVNSALDQPQNFFKSMYLKNTASNYDRLLDAMSTGVRTVQTAVNGIEALEDLLNLAELKALEAKEVLEKTTSALPNSILENDPIGYFRLNDVSTGTAANLGSLGAGGEGIYTGGVTQGDEILFYGAGGLPAKFSGSGQYVAVPNDDSINTGGPFPQRTVELIFNADTVSGRQVLWEEGGPVNNISIYIDNGRLYVNGRTVNAGGYGPFNISTSIEAGITYHVAFTQNSPNGNSGLPFEFAGYLNGEKFGSAPITAEIGSHPQLNGIGAVNEYVFFHDETQASATSAGPRTGQLAFRGEISDLAIYNTVLTNEELELRYESTSLGLSEQYRVDIVNYLEQIQGIVDDANFRGVSLLNNEELVVDFNRDNRNKLVIKGQGFSVEDLGLQDVNFQKPSQVADAINKIQKAIEQVREFGGKLSNNLNIIQARQRFTEQTIATALAGADDLTIADINKEGADLLATQTRLALGTTSLALGGQSIRNVLSLFV